MKYKCKRINCKTPFTIQMCLKIVKVQTFNIAYPCISLGSVHFCAHCTDFQFTTNNDTWCHRQAFHLDFFCQTCFINIVEEGLLFFIEIGGALYLSGLLSSPSAVPSAFEAL